MSSTSDTGRPPPPDARAIIAYAYELEQHAIRTLARAGELRSLAGLMQEDDENEPANDDPGIRVMSHRSVAGRPELTESFPDDDENEPVDDDPSPLCRCETCPAHGPFTCIGGDND